MRILCIMPCFAPEADSEAFCSAKMAIELRRSKVEIAVISLDPFKPFAKTIDDSICWKELGDITIRISSDTGKGKLISILSGINLHSFTYARWLNAVIDKAKKLDREKRFDMIYSRSLPMIGHVAGYHVSRELHRPWIANINDPWDWHLFPIRTSVKMSLLSRMDSNYWLRKTLRRADLVTYPAERLRDYHIKLSGIKHAAEIIPHIGYSMNCECTTKDFTLTHTGKLGSNENTGRSTRGLLRGFKEMLNKLDKTLNNTKLVLIGQRDIATESIIKELGIDHDRVEITGRVTYEESLRYICLSSVCILIEGNYSEGIFLPSKFADYVAAKKPILALSPRTGAIADFSYNHQIVRVDPEDSDGITSALCNFHEKFKAGALGLGSNHMSERFSADVVVKKFLQCADKLSQN